MTKVAALALASMVAGWAQGPAFEAASIKPAGDKSSPPINNPGTYTDRATLRLLMATAYGVPYEQVAGGPAWADSERFDVYAKAAGPATKAEMNEMLRTLLADRFQLKFHREKGMLAAYVLTVAKDGPKFGPKFHVLKEGDPMPAPIPSNSGWAMAKVDMKSLAAIVHVYLRIHFPSGGELPLTDPEQLPVIDQTGLPDEYYVVLDLHETRDWFMLMQRLGLKLEARKVPVDMLVIDSASRPQN